MNSKNPAVAFKVTFIRSALFGSLPVRSGRSCKLLVLAAHPEILPAQSSDGKPQGLWLPGTMLPSLRCMRCTFASSSAGAHPSSLELSVQAMHEELLTC